MTIVGHTKYSPDYVLGTSQKVWAVLDLKAPGISLDDQEAVGQVQSYCARGEKTSPLGVLFNGRSVRVFINPEYQGFAKYKKRSHDLDPAKQINFYEAPVDAADDDTSAIAQVLLKIAEVTLQENPASSARRMADAKVKNIKQGIWLREVRDRLRAALNDPSDEVVRAVASVDSIWVGMEKEPEPADAVIAWHRRKETPITVASVKATAKQSINGLLRQRVAEACKAKGWDYVQSRQIKGFRHRSVGGNGYYLVPQRDAVPLDLYVAGVPTADAELIISQLEQITKP